MKKLILGLFLLCSALTALGQDYEISITNGVTKSVSKKGDVFADRDCSKVIQWSINNIQKETGGSIELLSGLYFLNDEITITGWSNNQPPNAQVTIYGQGYSTQLVQNTKGQNGIVVKNSASVVLKSMYIYAGVNAKAGILFDADVNSKRSVWGGIIDGIFVQSNSLTDAAVHLKNFFDLSVPQLTVSSSDNHGIILENISNDVSYGNSNFGIVRSVCSTKAPYAGLYIKSSNPIYPMNLLTFQNYECVQGYRGISSMGFASSTFLLVDLEALQQPIYFDGSKANGNTRYIKILSGYGLALDKGTVITNTLYTGGNKFSLYVEDTAAKNSISDSSLYAPVNEYDLDVYMGKGKVDIKSKMFPLRIKRVDGSMTDNKIK
jgi:hypothetical protein